MTRMVSVVIPTKNAGSLFRDVLKAVCEQVDATSSEVLVIDSGSTDQTLDIAAEFPVRVEEIEPETFGHARTRNLGGELTDGEYLVYLTQDATPMEGWLDELVRPLENDDEIAGAYSRQIPREHATPMKKHFLEQFYPETAETNRKEGERLTRDDIFFSNVSSILRREVWEEIPFPEGMIMSEDQLWAKRILEAGYMTRYAAQSRVRHSHREGIVEIFKRYFDSGASLDLSMLESTDGFAREAVRYQLSELRYLVASGNPHWIPYAVPYNAAKFAGLLLGQYHEHLPRRVTRSASDTLSRKYDQ